MVHIHDKTQLNSQTGKKRILLVGAGHCAQLVIEDVAKNNADLEIIGLVDDNPSLKKEKIGGKDVLGTTTDIPEIASNYAIDEIMITMPSVTGELLMRIVDICRATKKPIKIFPAVFDIMERIDEQFLPTGNTSRTVNVLKGKAREIRDEDFIKRTPPVLNIEKIKRIVGESNVLILGAAGSIGKSIVKELVRMTPKKLILLDINECGIFNLSQRYKEKWIESVIGDIRDEKKMEFIIKKERPDIILHAAAYKHVPLMERYPEEAVKTNTIGTWNLLKLAHTYACKNFIFISTDKAVYPAGIMGMTKRVGEMIAQHMPKEKTKYSIVRFGNVVGSSGSLFRIWNKQIKHGKIDVTNPAMTRYFMSIQEAAMLTLETLSLNHKSNLYIFDMGEPINIGNLAKLFIKLKGHSENEIAINIIGMREGEKMHERLYEDGEELEKTANQRIFAIRSKELKKDDEFFQRIEQLKQEAENVERENIYKLLQEIIHNGDPTL